ncbi:U3 small nucleolar RNA-associated protein 6 homolog [Culicoides brevitarsis]|uniref:U3 small nucleolar RNA-associated protein 6 homolog n=1 Tax=Culicoides brevitarsis TaxID=469753 RepID=UPI00307B8FDA
MADFVQLRKELCLTEYEQMKKLRIFDDNEIRKIKRRREDFEYKTERHCKDIKDFCEFIKYERNLLNLIRERQQGTKHVRQKQILEKIVAKRVRGMYLRALNRFPGELRLWDSFFKFCQIYEFKREISKGVERMLNFHNTKPEAWLKGATLEYSENENLPKAKDLLITGMKHHPTNAALYKAFVQMELAEVRELFESEVKTKVDEGQIAMAVGSCVALYKNAKNNVNDVQFFLELLDVTLNFEYANALTQEIVTDLKEIYSTNAKTWDYFAQAELRGLSVYELDTEEIPKDKKVRSMKENIEKCVSMYETGLEQVASTEMCLLYIDAMLSLNTDMTSDANARRKALGNAFKRGHESGLMSSEHYLTYLKLLLEAKEGKDDHIESIFQKSLALHPKCSDLWVLQLKYVIRTSDHSTIQKTFEAALKAVDKDSELPVWETMYLYCAVQNNDKFFEDFFQKAISSKNSLVSSHFKPEYIEWVCLTKSLSNARQTYKYLTLNTTPCLELHRKMAQLETSQMAVNKTSARECYEFAVQFFGKTDVDTWIDYICFERDHGDNRLMGNIYERARKQLSSEALVALFIEKHNLVVSGVVKPLTSIIKDEEMSS